MVDLFAMSTVQTERAFQKQPQLFLASKKHANAEKKQRYVKTIGLKIETPKTAEFSVAFAFQHT